MTTMRVLVLIAASLSLLGSTSAQSTGGLIISEIMQNPDSVSDSEGEYIELYNSTSTDISLSGLTLAIDAESDQLTTGTVPAGGFAVLCVDGSPTENGGIDRCTIDYPDRMSLKNGGSTIVIADTNGTELERVHYDGGEAWPDPDGASMEYVGPPTGNTNDATNWQIATMRRGMFLGAGGDLGSPGAHPPGGNLPVELADFTVTASGVHISLSWITASETENAGFTVQHRGPEKNQWERRGFVQGQGSTSEASRYRFETHVERAGTHRFRLRQVDANGSSVVTGVRAVEVSLPSLLSVSGPNPIRAGEEVTATLKTEAQPVNVRLYNVLGQCIRDFGTLRSDGKAVTRVDIPTGELGSGTYFLRVTRGRQQEVRKLTVVQ